MIRFVILILILAAVCAVYTLHAKMEETEAKKGEKSGEKIIDDMIKKMADKGCISGLNFYPEFLSTDFSKRERKAYIKDAVEMLKYMVKVGGSEFVALGSDYDGFDDTLEWKDASGTKDLIDAMEREGFGHSLIENITYKNALRVIKEVVK